MVAVNGIYDGETVRLLEPINMPKNTRVIVTVLDETVRDEELPTSALLRLSAESGALDFLNAPEEDIYSDDDLKVRYQP